MLTVIIVIHLMLVLGLIGVVLLQKSEGGGLVSSTSGFMTGRGTANVLTRTTALLAVGFFITSLALSWLAGMGRHPASIINTGGGSQTQEAPAGFAGAAQPGWRRPRPVEIKRSPRGPAGRTQRAASATIAIGSKPMAQRASPALIAAAAGPASARPEDFAGTNWECGCFLRSLRTRRGSYSGISLVESGDRR